MKKFLLASAVLTGFAVPALAADVAKPLPPAKPAPIIVAQPGPQAWVGADVGWYNLSESGTSISDYTLNVSGAANVPLMGGPFNLEIEGRGTDVHLSSGGSSADLAIGAGYLHAFWRTPGMAIGGFAGFEDVLEIGFRSAGVEAQFYGPKINLYGQVAGVGTTFISTTGSAWWARGGLQFFLNPNFLIGGDVRYTAATLSGTSITNWLWDINAELRPAGQPFALYAEASSNKTTFSSGPGDITVNRVLAGVRIHVGNGTLQQAYTTGASMNVLPFAW